MKRAGQNITHRGMISSEFQVSPKKRIKIWTHEIFNRI